VSMYIATQYTEATTPALNATTPCVVGVKGGQRRGKIIFQNASASNVIYVSPGTPDMTAGQGFPIKAALGNDPVVFECSEDTWYSLSTGDTGNSLYVVEQV
jgi:hypothetical protein